MFLPLAFYTLVFVSLVLGQQLVVHNSLRWQRPKIARLSQQYFWSVSNKTFALNPVDSSPLADRSPFIRYAASGLPPWLALSENPLSFSGYVPSTIAPSIIPITVTAMFGNFSVQDSFELLVSSAPEPQLALSLSSQFVESNPAISSAFVVNPSSALAPYFSTDTALEDKAGLRIPPGWSFSIGLDALTFSPWPLFYTVTLASGDPLPDWLHYDAVSYTFGGVAPSVSNRSLEIVLSVSDVEGYSTSASDSFWLTVAAHELKLLNATQGILRNATLGDELELYVLDGSEANPLLGEVLWDATPIPLQGIRGVIANDTVLSSHSLSNRGYFASSVILTEVGASLPLQVMDLQGLVVLTQLHLMPVSSFFDIPSQDTLGRIGATMVTNRMFTFRHLYSQPLNLSLSPFVSLRGQDQLRDGTVTLQFTIDSPLPGFDIAIDSNPLTPTSHDFGGAVEAVLVRSIGLDGKRKQPQHRLDATYRREESTFLADLSLSTLFSPKSDSATDPRPSTLNITVKAYSSETRAISRLQFILLFEDEASCSSPERTCLPFPSPTPTADPGSERQSRKAGTIIGVVFACILVLIFVGVCLYIRRRRNLARSNGKKSREKPQPDILESSRNGSTPTMNMPSTLEKGAGGKLVPALTPRKSDGQTPHKWESIRAESEQSKDLAPPSDRSMLGPTSDTSGSRYEEGSAGETDVTRHGRYIAMGPSACDEGSSLQAHASFLHTGRGSAPSSDSEVNSSGNDRRRSVTKEEFFSMIGKSSTKSPQPQTIEDSYPPPLPSKITLNASVTSPMGGSHTSRGLSLDGGAPSPLLVVNGSIKEDQGLHSSYPLAMIQAARQPSDDGGAGFTVGTAVIYPRESRPVGTELLSEGYLGTALATQFEDSSDLHNLSQSLVDHNTGIKQIHEKSSYRASVSVSSMSHPHHGYPRDENPSSSSPVSSGDRSIGSQDTFGQGVVAQETPWRRADFSRARILERSTPQPASAGHHRKAVYFDENRQEQSLSSQDSTESVVLLTTAALAIRSSSGVKRAPSPQSSRSIRCGVSSPLSHFQEENHIPRHGSSSNARLVQFCNEYQYEAGSSNDSEPSSGVRRHSVYQGKREKSQKVMVRGTRGTPPTAWPPVDTREMATVSAISNGSSISHLSCDNEGGNSRGVDIGLLNDSTAALGIHYADHATDLTDNSDPIVVPREADPSASSHHLKPAPPTKRPTQYFDPAESSVSASNSSDPSTDSAVIRHHQGVERVLVGFKESFNFTAPMHFPGLSAGSSSRAHIMSLIGKESPSGSKWHLRAQAVDGGDLPSWLNFDDRGAEFWGIPEGAVGKNGIDVVVLLCKGGSSRLVAQFTLVIVGH
ncbi:hypothetical protein FRC17_010921 [Serendipita sp. 399]|nr:hypothetical protein FRC17_010921 [Serendipita sp. 399]